MNHWRLNLKPGSKFFRFTILDAPPEKRNNRFWYFCQCDCGTKKWVHGSAIKSGKTKSCGCMTSKGAIGKAILIERMRTHGMSRTRIYKNWEGMVRRCHDPRSRYYKNYGGRGIKVCDRWRKFENFFADMGYPPPKHTIERINNSLGYSPENCRYATMLDQLNNKRSSRFLTFRGVTMTVSQWTRHLKIPVPSTIFRRLYKGWSIERALTEKVTAKNAPHRVKNITFNGETMHIAAWAKRIGISAPVISARLGKLKWPIEKALTTPIVSKYSHG